MSKANESKILLSPSPDSSGPVRISYQDFTQSEILMLRTIVSDRIERWFARAATIAQQMDMDNLVSVVEEIRRLKEIHMKLGGTTI